MGGDPRGRGGPKEEFTTSLGKKRDLDRAYKTIGMVLERVQLYGGGEELRPVDVKL